MPANMVIKSDNTAGKYIDFFNASEVLELTLPL